MKYSPSDKTAKPPIHYASVGKATGGLSLFLDILPDPDVVLKKAGKGVEALRELLGDDQMESAWNVRKAALKKTGWMLVPGGESALEKKAAEEMEILFSETYDMDRIQGEMVEAAGLGFSPLEIIWVTVDGKWIPSDLVGKPTEWFNFGEDKELRFRSSYLGSEPVPPNRFLIVSNNASYANPYGVKQFSKCYWPVQFKRNGWKWWALFMEKFGGAFLTGNYDENASEEDKEALLNGLYDLISGGAAIFPEKTRVDTLTDAHKASAGNIFQKFEEFSNAAIAKVILGQTLTTEVLSGSMAAANIHNLVREDIRLSDLKMCSSAWNRLCKMYTYFNYGKDVRSPRFIYEGEEDLQTERTTRDKSLNSMGVRFTETYFEEVYGLKKEHFTVDASGNTGQSSFSVDPAGALLFSQNSKSDSLMDEYSEKREKDGQASLDKMADLFMAEINKADNFDDARERVIKAMESKKMFGQREALAKLLNDIRYVGINSGADDA